MPSASSSPLPDVTAIAEPVIVLDDDTPPEHALEPPENEESAWDEPAQCTLTVHTAQQAPLNRTRARLLLSGLRPFRVSR